jgi:hypothetical protein
VSQQFAGGDQFDRSDKQEKATQTVIEQAEVLSQEWAVA